MKHALKKTHTASVPLNRALSKLNILSRSQATEAIRAGRVRVNGRVVSDPAVLVVPERVRVTVDGERKDAAAWRTIAFHKPRGVLTTRRDPDGRPTVFDVLGHAGDRLVVVGRLDWATSGLLLLTSDTQLADWLTDPGSGVARVYAVTVRGRVEDQEIERLRHGVDNRGERLRPHALELRKRSAKESHLIVELAEGRNREIRRLFEAIGHEVARLKRIRFGGLALDALAPGAWRDVAIDELRAAFPGARMARRI